MTVISAPYWLLKFSSYIDEFIEAPLQSVSVINQAADFLRKSNRTFDLTILAPDALIWALVDSEIEPSTKMKLYPIGNLSYLSALDGKIGVADTCKKLNLLVPPSRAVQTKTEAVEAAHELGFPVMLKVSRSGGGNGVFQCNSPDEVAIAPISTEVPFLVEKTIEGDSISIEPHFLHSQLLGYSYSTMLYTGNPFKPSLERVFKPYPKIEPILKKLGDNLQLNGFFNITMIRDRETNEHYLIELDFRPNRWVKYGKFVGVDWSKALKTGSFQTPQKIRQLNLFPSDLFQAIRSRNWARVIPWILNKNRRWKSIPLYDKKLLFLGAPLFFKKIFTKGTSMLPSKSETPPSGPLYQIISAAFCVIVVISNILSAKMVKLPLIDLSIPAGLITYPLTFLLADLTTEIYGARRAKLMVYIALGMNLLSFGMIQIGLSLPTQGDDKAFQAVLGLSGLRIFSSLVSYITAQIVDIQLYAAIKRWTGPNLLWLRNNGSTCLSQIVDTVMIDLIFLWWGLGMTMSEIFPIMLFSYAYKAFFSVACTPLFYLLVYSIRTKKQEAL